MNDAVNGSLGNFDLRPTLAKLKIPVLVIEEEKRNVPLDSTREWTKSPRNARLLLIPDAGHATFIDQPTTLLREIEVFLHGDWPDNSKKNSQKLRLRPCFPTGPIGLSGLQASIDGELARVSDRVMKTIKYSGSQSSPKLKLV